MRARAAPSAVRTAISRWRPVARARSRFAMLAQAIRRMKPTAAIRTIKLVRAPCVYVSWSGSAKKRGMPALVSGYARASRLQSTCKPALACDAVEAAFLRFGNREVVTEAGHHEKRLPPATEGEQQATL